MTRRDGKRQWWRLPPTGPLRAPRGRLPATSAFAIAAYLVVSLTAVTSPSGETDRVAGAAESARPRAPSGTPIVTIGPFGIDLDGHRVAGRLDAHESVDALAAALLEKRGTRCGPARVLVALDGEVPVAVVRSVVLAAARSGYPNVEFVVLRS